MKAQNRRYIIRWQFNRQARVKLGESENFVPCQLKDMNLKGCQIALEEKLEKDTFLKLCLVCGDEFTLDAEVWVAWHRSIDGLNLYGLYFTKIKDSDKERIYKYIHKHCSEQIIKQQWKEPEGGGEIMQNAKFDDRRIFARFPVKLPLRYFDLNPNREGQAETCDVSAKGIGLVINEALQPKAALEMWLSIPNQSDPLYTRGEVVWSRMVEPGRYRAGVELEKADFMGMSRVLRYQ